MCVQVDRSLLMNGRNQPDRTPTHIPTMYNYNFDTTTKSALERSYCVDTSDVLLVYQRHHLSNKRNLHYLFFLAEDGIRDER